MTEPTDNIYYYPAYLLILVIFYFVLKSPKTDDKKTKDVKKEDN